MKLKFFDCMLRLGGDPLLMQIPKSNVSEREIRVLRFMHGDDAVTQIQPTMQPGVDHEREVSETEHYYELVQKFDNDRALIERIFNVTLDGFDRWFDERSYQQDQERVDRERERLERANQVQQPASTVTPETESGAKTEIIE